MKIRQMGELRVKCGNKPQLRNYVLYKNFDVTPPLLQKPLTFIQRKYLCKLTTSCLELRVCTGRYVQLPEEDRVCEVTRECKADKRVENEYHYLFYCSAYAAIREQWLESATLGDDFHQLSDVEKVKVVINMTNVKLTAQYIVDAFNQRLRILFLKSADK